MTCFVLKAEKRVLMASTLDAATNQTFPATDRLIYTNPVAAIAITSDDDDSNNISDFYGRAHSATLRVEGGSVRIGFGADPTAAKGLLLNPTDVMEFENQEFALKKLKIIAVSGTPVVQIQLWG